MDCGVTAPIGNGYYSCEGPDTPCCSFDNFCGLGDSFCNAKCQPEFGNCFDVTSWTAPASGSFMVVSPRSFNAWATVDDSSDIGAELELYNFPFGYASNPGALWTFSIWNDLYMFQDVIGNTCLDVEMEIQSPLFQGECLYSPTQLWIPIYIRPSDSAVQWQLYNTTFCIEGDDQPDFGSPELFLWECKSADDPSLVRQLWLPRPVTYVDTVSSASGLILSQDLQSSLGRLNAFSRHASLVTNLPPLVDWTGSFGEAKDQSACGSCSIFAVVGAIEGLYNNKSSATMPKSYSEQQVMDCGLSCEGSWPEQVMATVANLTSGLVLTSVYGNYTGQAGTCQAMPPSNVRLVRFEQVPPFKESLLMAALTQQPVVAYIMLTDELLYWRLSTIFTDATQSCVVGGQLSHAILLVGYGTENGVPFWNIRNSFGPTWGNGGYARIKRGICGVTAMPPVYPVLAWANPCFPINPCGAGRCTRLSASSSSYNCSSCPTGFVVAINTDGKQTCVIVDVCGTSSVNPCTAGMCVNRGDGMYGCVCFRGYVLDINNEGRPVCGIPLQNNTELPTTYTIQKGDTCELVIAAFGLTTSRLNQMNPRVGRTTICPFLPSDVKTTLNVSNPGYTCQTVYSMQKGDNCKSIADNFGMSQDHFRLTLNPGLNCSTPNFPAGLQVCLARGTSNVTKVITNVYTVTEIDRKSWGCASIRSKYPISILEFFDINSGINCGEKLAAGQQVSVAYQSKPPEACTPFYTWQTGDTCQNVMSKFCGSRNTRLVWGTCMGSAAGACIGTGSTWKVGRIICVKTCFDLNKKRIGYCTIL